MPSPLNVEINNEYFETTTDGSKCAACEELILSKMFQMVVFINTEPVYTRFKFCETCYNVNVNDPGRKK